LIKSIVEFYRKISYNLNVGTDKALCLYNSARRHSGKLSSYLSILPTQYQLIKKQTFQKYFTFTYFVFLPRLRKKTIFR